MKKWLSLILVMTMLCAGAIQAQAAGTGVLALGADLSADQRATVLSEMGITEAEAASYVYMERRDSFRKTFGVGVDSNITKSSIKAMISAINRLYK